MCTRVGQKVKNFRVQFPYKHKSVIHVKIIIVPKMDFWYISVFSSNFVLKIKPKNRIPVKGHNRNFEPKITFIKTISNKIETNTSVTVLQCRCFSLVQKICLSFYSWEGQSWLHLNGNTMTGFMPTNVATLRCFSQHFTWMTQTMR